MSPFTFPQTIHSSDYKYLKKDESLQAFIYLSTYRNNYDIWKYTIDMKEKLKSNEKDNKRC